MYCGFRVLCLAFLACLLIFSSAGCSNNVDVNQSGLQGYPIASDVFTTLQRTVVPDPVPSSAEKIYPYEVSKYEKNGYGKWHYGPGLPYVKRLNLMSSDYNAASNNNTTELLHFFTISDIHITDKQSPAQSIYFGYKSGVSSAYSPVMLYTTQVLDAAIQTINSLQKEKPFDFGIALGDDGNSAEYNEMRWFIDDLDCRNINPNSDPGIKEDPVPGPYNDYQDEYKAAGLNKSINWYAALGNHDHFWMGVNPVDDYLRQAYTGDNMLCVGNLFINPNFTKSRDFYMGSIDGRKPYGDVYGVGPVGNFSTPPKVLAANPNRRSLSREEWISEFFNTTSSPKGHGFNQSNAKSGFACYAFEPKSNVPLKVIVLDDTQSESDPNIHGYGKGSLDKERYDWLVSELDKGQVEGQLMIIAAHIPIGVQYTGILGPSMNWSSSAAVSEKDLIAKLHTYPNLILWIAGHRHLNTVTPLKSPDPAHPELGFWVVETASLRDFPQQLRTFDVVHNSDNTISIFATDVDPAVKNGSLAAQSRSYAIAAQELFNNTMVYEPSGSYNAELVKQLSPGMGRPKR